MYEDQEIVPIKLADSLSCGLFVVSADDLDMMVDEIDLVAGANFFALAGFDFAIDAEETVGDNLFGAAAAFGEAFEFQYFIEFDKFGLEFGNNFF